MTVSPHIDAIPLNVVCVVELLGTYTLRDTFCTLATKPTQSFTIAEPICRLKLPRDVH